jgi:hypothetical protein
MKLIRNDGVERNNLLPEKMMRKMPDKYSTAAISLLAMSALFIAIALLANLGDFTSATFVMAGMVCAMVGIFTFAFSGTEQVDPDLVGILPAQGSINFCSLSHYFGITGNAFFIPPQFTGKSRVMQFNPITTMDGFDVLSGKKQATQESFQKTGSEGFVTEPSCDMLIRDLQTRNALVIPENKEELSTLLCESIEDVFKFAQKISVIWEDDTITVTFYRYPFIYGCEKIAEGYPVCCAISPCPACSLCGSLIAEGSERIVFLNRCSMNSSGKDVTAVFSIVPLPDSNP